MRQLHILRRQGGVAKYVDLRAGITTVIVYADHIEPPLRRRHTPQVIACHLRNLPSFMSIDGSCCGLHISRGPSLNFDKTKHIFVPSDQIDLSTIFRRSIIPGHDGVASFSQVEIDVLFSAHAYTKMRWHPRGRKNPQCAPIQHLDAATSNNSKETWEHASS